MSKPSASPLWMELSIDRIEDAIRVSARSSRGEQTTPRTLDPAHDAPAWLRFAAAVERAAACCKPLSAALLTEAQASERALLAGEIAPMLARLHEAAGGAPVLVRLMIHDRALQAVPWEALCKPETALGFWGNSPDLHPVRGVHSNEPWLPREVRGAVRVLAIAPTGGSLATLKLALEERITKGEIEWLDPITGPAARQSKLFDRLRREPLPHVLHFLGHGGMDEDENGEPGKPVLRLADDDDGEETWIAVEILAQQLKASFRGGLRLVVLEACEGAKTAAFASAAETLAQTGADAVVAHLWPVHADAARAFSAKLYRVLAGAERGGGDIALAMNEARRSILGEFQESAEASSPVLYLRGPGGVIFDFAGRKVAPPLAWAAAVPAAASGIDRSLARLLRAPFSLLLGDRGKDDRAAVTGFRDKLHKELEKGAHSAPSGLPMSTFLQRFALRRGTDRLGIEFQKAFRMGAPAPPIVTALAPLLGPGVHTTLLRIPWLEHSLAEAQPYRTIYVIQPGEEGALVMKRGAGYEAWEEFTAAPEGIDLAHEILVLRPYRGYTPEQVFTRPLLTEDDYYLRLREIWSTLPVDLTNVILRALSRQPALILGLSVLTGHHRMLLHTLHPRGLPRESLAVIEEEDAEHKLWASGAGLPGKDGGVGVLETTNEALLTALRSIEDRVSEQQQALRYFFRTGVKRS